MTAKPRVCKDCLTIDGQRLDRNATHPGPRCATHWRAEKKRRSAAAHESRVLRVYAMPPGTYARLYEAQGGTCAIHRCRAAGGGARRLAVDHDHTCCAGPETCGNCTRGLLCQIHNEWIGRAGDDPAVFDSIAEYLRNPPARRVLTD